MTLLFPPLVLAAACASESGPTGTGDLVIEPIPIDSVEVAILESFPPQATAHVQGVLGDGCSELNSIRQERSGNLVTVTILRERPRDAICTQIAKLYDDNIPLEGQYPPGQYTLRVNDVTTSFATQ
jgi:hypothetical protein